MKHSKVIIAQAHKTSEVGALILFTVFPFFLILFLLLLLLL